VAANQPLLVVDDLECVRDGRVLFSGLSLRVQPSQVIALQGANGAGKSTLLRCIAGLYPDYEGAVSIAGFIYSGHKPGLSGALTTLENLTYLAGLDFSVGRDPVKQAAVVDALEQVGLAGYENVRCANLSAGQLRRVGLARLTLGRAPLWLLDEPLTALDDAGVELLGRVLRQHLENGGGAVCATHHALPLTDYSSVELAASGTVSLDSVSTLT